MCAPHSRPSCHAADQARGLQAIAPQAGMSYNMRGQLPTQSSSLSRRPSRLMSSLSATTATPSTLHSHRPYQQRNRFTPTIFIQRSCCYRGSGQLQRQPHHSLTSDACSRTKVRVPPCEHYKRMKLTRSPPQAPLSPLCINSLESICSRHVWCGRSRSCLVSLLATT